jgi:hypothetical protein
MAEIKKPIKVMWFLSDNLRHVDYFDNEVEAQKAILNSHDRRWGKALILYWVELLGKYCSIPERE